MVTAMAAALTRHPHDPSIADRLRESFAGWRRLAAAHAAGDDLTGLDPWAARHLDRLARLEAAWPQATEGSALLHLDLRADNLLLTPTGVAVDWPVRLRRGRLGGPAPAPAQRGHAGRPDPEPTFAAHPVAAGADPWAVTTALAACAGYLAEGSHLRPPPGLPTSAPSSTGRPWSPSSGCGCGPAGPDRSRPLRIG
jgi:hypothetical protein